MKFLKKLIPENKMLLANFFFFVCINTCFAAISSCGKVKTESSEEKDSMKIKEPVMNVKMRSVIIPSTNSEAVVIRIFFKTGSVDDPEGKEGLTNLTARMMAEGGAGKHSYEEIIQLLYPMAASIDVDVDKEVTVFTGKVHKSHINEYLPIFFAVLLEPKFEEEDFKRLKEETLNYLRKDLRETDDERLSREALDIWIYENHPYGHVNQGTVSGVQSITLEDIKNHYKKVFTKDRLTIGLAGAVDDEMRKVFEQKLSALPESGNPIVKIPDAEMPEGIEVRIINKVTESTAISIGAPVAVKRGHPDFYPLMLAFSVLGEHRQSSGRLFRSIREARGLNYGDYAYIEHFVQEGSSVRPMVNVPRSKQEMSIWIRSVQTKHAVFALNLAIFEFKRFCNEGISQEEFERTKGFLSGYTRVLEEPLSRRLGYALDDLFYSIAPFLSTGRKIWNEINLEDVNTAIKRNISPENLKIVIVTSKPEEIKKEIIEGTIPPVEYDTPKPDSVYSQDRKIQLSPLKVKEEKIKVIHVDSLFE